MAGLVVGVPKEIKEKEGRVSVQPDGVAELVYDGREVVVQAGAGSGCGFPDDEYVAAGARVVGTADEVFAAADLIVKVKEPIPDEYDRFRPGQQLFTYLHLAADRRLTEFLLDRRIDSIAYETVQTADGRLPLLTPMSEVAGRMAVQVLAAHHLDSHPPGNLAHRREQRQPPVLGLHSLVCDPVDTPVKEELGEPAVGRQVQVGEQLLTRAEPVIFLGDGLLDLDDQVRSSKHLVCGADNPGAGRNVLVVGEATARPAPACTTTSRPS